MLLEPFIAMSVHDHFQEFKKVSSALAFVPVNLVV